MKCELSQNNVWVRRPGLRKSLGKARGPRFGLLQNSFTEIPKQGHSRDGKTSKFEFGERSLEQTPY